MITQVKVIRHSERLDYANPIYWLFCIGHYWADPPLTTSGHDYAYQKGFEIFASGFDVQTIYTSPYARTIETATEIKASYPQANMIIEPLLSEYQPSYKHRVNLYPNGIPTSYCGNETSFNYPELYEDFVKRVDFIIDALLRKQSENFIIITHGEFLKVCINHIQTLYPDLLLDPKNISYLTALSFDYDKDTNTIIESSVKIE